MPLADLFLPYIWGKCEQGFRRMAARNKPAGIRLLVYGMGKPKDGIEGFERVYPIPSRINMEPCTMLLGIESPTGRQLDSSKIRK